LPTSKKFLSEKKTAQQTISISPALKDWIERYVNVTKKDFPKDKRFKSISSFYNYVMEKTMEILSYGKTLDDFQMFVDYQTKSFFEKLTFRAFLPLHEECVRTHRYVDLSLKDFSRFLFLIRNRYLDGVEPYDFVEIQKRFDILRNFYLENKIVKDIHLEIMSDDKRHPKGIFYWTGNYKNLFWENSKMNAAVFGIIGVKITKVIYSERDLYCRFNLRATDLMFGEEKPRKLREKTLELANSNVKSLLKHQEILKDDDFYLWMKFAEDKEAYIKFHEDKVRDQWIKKIIEDIENNSKPEEIIPSLLKFFSKLHWLDIENMASNGFKIRLSEEDDNKEIDYLLDILSKYSNIAKTEGKYYLEQKIKL
jgi:hypothetical protein